MSAPETARTDLDTRGLIRFRQAISRAIQEAEQNMARETGLARALEWRYWAGRRDEALSLAAQLDAAQHSN